MNVAHSSVILKMSFTCTDKALKFVFECCNL